MRVVRGDLLASGARYIFQQCNCVTRGSAGLARAIETRFPYCRPYARHEGPHVSAPGTARVYTNWGDSDAPRIVCLFAQYYPGPPGAYERRYEDKPPPPAPDSAHQRLLWFAGALDDFLAPGPLPGRMAMPFIGCGLAGGKWDDYKSAIERIEKRYGIEFEIYDGAV